MALEKENGWLLSGDPEMATISVAGDITDVVNNALNTLAKSGQHTPEQIADILIDALQKSANFEGLHGSIVRKVKMLQDSGK